MGKLWERFVAWMGSSRRAKPVFILCGLLVVALFVSSAIILLNSVTGQNRQLVMRGSNDPEWAMTAFSTALKESAVVQPGERRVDLGEPGGGTGERKIVYNASMTLETPDPDGVYAFVMGYMKEQNGYVASSRRWVDADERLHIQMRLRLPAPALETALAAIGGLGRIVEESLTGRDVTEEYYDLEARLGNKKRQEERYVEILQAAKTVEEVLQVERELERIRGDIESMEGRFRYLQDQTELATLNLLCREPSRLGTGVFRPGEFFQEIGKIFLKSLRLLVLAVTVVLPWLVIAGLVLLAVLAGRKRKRE
ncbi:MAG: DUF4349 domain-containing protein [Clostridia bacterium]|nr:DUF4349 domain-containing protein [Clostridia bacterium]